MLSLVMVAGISTGCLGRDFLFFESINPPRPFQIMAHQGEAHQAPANTRAALARCIEDGLEWASIDVRLTKDNQLIVIDDTVSSSGTPWRAENHTLEEALALDVGAIFASRFANEKVLTLAEAFQLARAKLNLCLECKHVDAQRLVQAILDARMQNQIVVSDDLENLQQIGEISQGKVATIASWRAGAEIVSWAATNHLAAVDIAASEATPGLVEMFHTQGLKVRARYLESDDSPKFWDQVLATRVDWVQTALPEELYAHALWQRIPHRPVRFSCHRGANRYAPENTLPAFDKAIKLGADFVEFDIRTTSDGQYFLLHDSLLDRTTDGHGAIGHTPASILANLNAGMKYGRPFNAVKLPTLDEFLSFASGKIDLYVDAKVIPPDALAEALERYHMADRAVVYQGAAYLEKLKIINPHIRALPPVEKPEEVDELAAHLKPHAIDTDWKILSKDFIDHCHTKGILVFSDALDTHEDVEDYLRAINWGIDLIQTDHPLRVMRAIELWALQQNPAVIPQSSPATPKN